MKIPPKKQVSSAREESTMAVPWTLSTAPRKILVIRLQAFGDVVITLPCIQALRTILPSTEFHYLTRQEFSAIPKNMTSFNSVFTIGGGRNLKRQWLHVIVLLPTLLRAQYDIVIDLQRNSMSRMIRRILHPKSFCEFDRFSPLSAVDRTTRTIDTLGFLPIPHPLPRLDLRETDSGLNKLISTNWKDTQKLIVLNPAGNVETKNWPLDYYEQFAKTWVNSTKSNNLFVVIGQESIRPKADYLKSRLGDKLISLVGLTTQSEAFNILQKIDFVLTEDSGLMHMAWISEVPVIALFGSTRSVWSKPMGNYSVCLDSSDLECGECSQPTCRYGDIHCLTRHTPETVFRIAQELLQRKESSSIKDKP